MDNWKRMIPGVTGASLALGGMGCGGSDSAPTPAQVAQQFCSFAQACTPDYFYFDTVDECVTDAVNDWNTELAPELQAMGGARCESAYLSLYDCYLSLQDIDACTEPSDAALAAECLNAYNRMVDSCTNPGGHGAEIEAIATARCQDLQACEPTYFTEYYDSFAECVSEHRFEMADGIAGASEACGTAMLAYSDCRNDSYTVPACTGDSSDCASQYSAMTSACSPVAVATSGLVNKDRSAATDSRPRWLRDRR